jgi:hypothetical protein
MQGNFKNCSTFELIFKRFTAVWFPIESNTLTKILRQGAEACDRLGSYGKERSL